jgi:phenylacetate-CoA ligase
VTEALADRYFDPVVETMRRPDLRRLQETRLAEMAAYAYERSGLVRSLWDAAGVAPADLGGIDDFSRRVPFTSKAATLAYRARTGDPFGGMCTIDAGAVTFAGVSSGTTGSTVFFPEALAGDIVEQAAVPVPSWPFSSTQQATWDRNLWEMGLRPGDHMLFSSYTFRGPNFHPCLAVGGIPILTDHYPRDFPRMVRLARELRPTVLYLVSGPMMIELERHASAEVLADAFSSFRGIAWGGEPLGPRKRRLLEEWGVHPLQVANVGDASGAIECHERTGAHAWEDTVLVEVLDPDGREVPDGSIGELVVTSLTNRTSPQMRWRSDDLVRVDRRRCGCGRTHARVAIVGRSTDLLLVDGRAVVPADVMPAVESIPATEAGLFQVIRRGAASDTLELRVGYASGSVGALGPLRAELADALYEALGVPCAIELVEQEVLLQQGPPHKIPRVVDH